MDGNEEKDMKKEIVKSFNKLPNDIPTTFRTDIIKIDAGNKHTCAIKEIPPPTPTPDIGTLGCWGNNLSGQSDIPSSFAEVSVIALGSNHTCAISPRMLACWGNNQFGQTTVPIAFRKA